MNPPPIALFIFNRPDLVRRCLNQLSKFNLNKLYIFADGPRNKQDEVLCNECQNIAKKQVFSYDVEIICRDLNHGMTSQITNGLNQVFKYHESVIFLQDDHMISRSSYDFCKELLVKYKNTPDIGHINLSNLAPYLTLQSDQSFFFSHCISVWGFATWKRVWSTYSPQMEDWGKINQKAFLKNFFKNKKHRNNVKNMYDVHFDNQDPWTWDYQWEFNCLNNAPYSITPSKNLCVDVGFERDDAIHNKGQNPFYFPLGELTFPLSHPKTLSSNHNYDRHIIDKICPDSILFKSIRFIKKLKSLRFNIKK